MPNSTPTSADTVGLNDSTWGALPNDTVWGGVSDSNWGGFTGPTRASAWGRSTDSGWN